MCSVHTVVSTGDLGEVDEFLRGSKSAGDVDESGGESDGSVLHGFFGDLFHAFHFIGGGVSVGAADDGASDIVLSDEAGDVDG